MKNTQKKFLSAVLAASSVAGVVAPAVTTFAATATEVDTLVANALKDKTFFSFNVAYGAILSLPTADQGKYLAQIAPLEKEVRTAKIDTILNKIEEFYKTESVATYDEIYYKLIPEVPAQIDRDYLSSELYKYGKPFYETKVPDYPKATDAIIAVDTALQAGKYADAQALVPAAEAAIAKVTSEVNNTYLKATLAEVVGRLTTASPVSVSSATVVGTKSVQVKFNKAVDTTKAALQIKKGAAIYGTTVTWNDAKDTATLTTVVALPAADYSVEVTGLTDATLTKAFTVAAEVASKVEVASTTVSLKDSATIAFKVSNQYGEDMKISGTASGVVVSAYNTTQKRVETLTNLTADNKLTFSTTFATAASPAKLNDVVRVTVAYAGLTAQSNVTVVSPAASSTIAFGDIAPLTNKARISVSETGLAVPYTLFDQYGAAAKLAAHTADQDTVSNVETISGIQFVSSNPAIVDVDTFAVDADGKLTFATGSTDGTAIITAIINETGAITTFTVNVNKAPLVDSLGINAPTALIAAGESVKLDITALDQFGGAIAAKDVTGSTTATSPAVTLSSSNTSVVANDTNLTISAGKLNVKTLAAGTTTITAKVGTKTVGTVTVVVEAAATATQIKSISFGPKFEITATKTLTTSDFVVIDQYGRTIDKANIAIKSVVEKTAADTIFTLSGAGFTADNAGSSVMTLVATYTNPYTLTANDTTAFDFTLSAVASSDVTSYEITAVPTIYGDVAHAKALELVGKTSAGDKVVLKPGKITSATSSDTSKVTVAVASNVATVTGVSGQEGTSVVALWNQGTKLAETTVTLSKVAPVATTVSFSSPETAMAATVNLKDNLVVKDQYGVAIVDNGFWTTSDSAKATVSSDYSVGAAVPAGTVTLGTMATGDTVTIGYVSTNGLVVTTVLTK